MKYQGIVKGADSSFAVYHFIYNGVTENEARRAIINELAKRSFPGAKAELWSMKNEQIDQLLTHWEVDEMFAISEQISIYN